MAKKKSPRRKSRKYQTDALIADFKRLPPKRQHTFLQEMRRRLQNSGYLLVIGVVIFWLLHTYL